MDQLPIRVGAMLYTMVDPHRGYEVAYNNWYEQDHFYGGCMIGPGMLAGCRWVAPRRLKDLRFPETSPFADPIDAGSFLSIYWVNDDQVEEHFTWASKQVWSLYQSGRGFDERTHAQTGVYDFLGSQAAVDHPVPITLALDHRYEGLAVVVVEPVGGTDPAAAAAALAQGPQKDLLTANGVAQASSWALRGREALLASGGQAERTSPMPLGAPGGTLDRVVQLMFCKVTPDLLWDQIRLYADQVESSGIGTVSFAAPVLPTVVGTETHTDELW